MINDLKNFSFNHYRQPSYIKRGNFIIRLQDVKQQYPKRVDYAEDGNAKGR